MKKVEQKFNVPWITKDGYFDLSKFPIDTVLKQTLSKDYEEFYSGCGLLQTMHRQNRPEAAVYLLGLLHYYQNDLERLIVIIEKLWGFHTVEYADLLFSELRRVKSSNTTRKYLNTVIEMLSYFPKEMVQDRFQELSKDKSFSYKMRRKFQDIVEMGYYRPYID